MAIPDPNNPAARLLNLIERLRAKPNDQPAFHAWGNILIVQPEHTFELLERVGRVMRLPKITHDALSAIPGTSPLYFQWVPSLEEAFKAHRLVAALREFLAPISDHAVNTLQFCADRLDNHAREAILKNDDLTKLRREAVELRIELENAEIDPALKKFAWDRLKPIIAALDDYEFFGVEAIRRATQEALGAVALNQEASLKLNETSIGKKLFVFGLGILNLLAALDGTLQLPGDVRQFLIAPPPAAIEVVPNPVPLAPDPLGVGVYPESASPIEIAGPGDDTKNGSS
jgi:hypothetical protein